MSQYVLKLTKIELYICIYNGFVKCAKRMLNEEKNEGSRLIFEGLYFTIALGNLVQIWYVGC